MGVSFFHAAFCRGNGSSSHKIYDEDYPEPRHKNKEDHQNEVTRRRTNHKGQLRVREELRGKVAVSEHILLCN